MISEERKKRILFYGDSNTHGYNTKTTLRYPKEVRFTGRLASCLQDSCEIVEAGLNSRTTNIDDDEKGFLNGRQHIEACVLSSTPLDVIVLMLGTNDFKVKYHRDVMDSIKALEELVRLCRVHSEHKSDYESPAKILLLSPIEIGSWIKETKFAGEFDEESVAKVKRYIEEVEKLAKRLDCEYLALSSYALPCQEDALHLDENGHKAVADALAEKLRDMLKE